MESTLPSTEDSFTGLMEVLEKWSDVKSAGLYLQQIEAELPMKF